MVGIFLSTPPRAKRDEIVGVEGTALKVRLNAPPVEGRANESLLRLLSSVIDVGSARVEILRGATSRHKLVRVRGLSLEQVKEKLPF